MVFALLTLSATLLLVVPTSPSGATSYLLIFLFYMVVLQLLSVIIVYIKSDSTIYYYEGAHRRIWMDGMRHGYCRMVGGGGSGEVSCGKDRAHRRERTISLDQRAITNARPLTLLTLHVL